MKPCNKCQVNKNLSDFPTKGKYSSGKTRIGNTCKACNVLRESRRYAECEDKKSRNARAYRKSMSKVKDMDEYRAYSRAKNKRYKDRIRKDPVAYAIYLENRRKNRNKDKCREYNSLPEVRKKNNLSTAKYIKNRYITDQSFKLRKIVSSVINKALHEASSSKSNVSCLQFLPYTFEELKRHLESLFEPWMTWSNWKKYDPKTWNDNDSSTWTWNLDHIIPQSELPYASMKDDNFQKCWALINLRPYSAKRNIMDGATKVRHKKAA